MKHFGTIWFVAALTVAGSSSRADTRYVDPKSPSPAEPYTSAKTAAHDIQTAVTAAEKDDTVQVAAGTYKIAKTIAVGKGITLVGAGADKTTIDAESKCSVLSVSGATVKGFTITGGKSRSGGGVQLGPGATLAECTITKNAAERYGGGIYARKGGERLVSNCTISENRVTKAMHTDTPWGGGGAYIEAGTTIRNSLIKDNVSPQRGGGVWSHAGGVTLNCTITGNRAGGRGGNRSMQEGGGGAFMDFGGSLRGCVVYGNHANVIGGGAVLSTGGNARNCTFVGNTAGASGGGVQTVGVAGLVSSILYGNTRTGKKTPCDLYVSHYYHRDIHQLTLGKAYVKHSLIGATKIHHTRQRFYLGRTAGYSPNWYKNKLFKTKCIEGVDPQFVDAAAGDYRLKPDSPCINAGLNEKWHEGEKDRAGKARVQGDTVDIGAYEAAASK